MADARGYGPRNLRFASPCRTLPSGRLHGNYGEASAVAFFAPHVPVISVQNQYWLWGTRGYSGNVLIQIGGTCFRSDGLFASGTLAATVQNRWAIAYENNPIWVCRGIKKPLAQVWPSIKNYD